MPAGDQVAGVCLSFAWGGFAFAGDFAAVPLAFAMRSLVFLLAGLFASAG
jgi:hypothetical protein